MLRTALRPFSLRKLSLLSAALPLALLIGAGPASAQAEKPALACTGPFAPNATPESLAKAFGAANVTTEETGGEEKEKITVLFARDKAQRLEIFWREDGGKRSIASIQAKAGSAWRMPQGIAIGTPLAEVEKLNGKPFLVSGFGWEMGGTTRGWQNGKLQTQAGNCFLMLRFKPTKPAKANIEGDREFPSSNASVKAAAPVVDLIALHYPD
jgi:hypothetical protein